MKHKFHYIGCADGSVLHVHYRFAWGYHVAGPQQKQATFESHKGAIQSYADAQEAARKAAEARGGIAWESTQTLPPTINTGRFRTPTSESLRSNEDL